MSFVVSVKVLVRPLVGNRPNVLVQGFNLALVPPAYLAMKGDKILTLEILYYFLERGTSPVW